jgi:hypothetical protein
LNTKSLSEREIVIMVFLSGGFSQQRGPHAPRQNDQRIGVIPAQE